MSNQNLQSKYAQVFHQLQEAITREKEIAMQNMTNQAYQQVYNNMQYAGLDPNQFLKRPQFPANSPPINVAMGDEHAQDMALMSMNPIARHKYEELFKILEIKVRFVNMVRGTFCSWILAKEMPNAGIVRQEWSAPSKDPGCSLRTWDAMVSELMDEVARRGGVDVKTDFDHRPESAGHEANGSSGNT